MMTAPLTGEAAVERVMELVPSKTGASEDTAVHELLSDGLYSMLVEDPNVTEDAVREMARAMLTELIASATNTLAGIRQTKPERS